MLTGAGLSAYSLAASFRTVSFAGERIDAETRNNSGEIPLSHSIGTPRHFQVAA